MTDLPGDLATFAERLRYLVRASTLTQQRFAEECGISQAALEKYLRGGTPSTDAVIKICLSRAVSADWLLLGHAPRPRVSRGFVRHLLTRYGEELLAKFIDEALSQDDPAAFLAENRWMVITIAQEATSFGIEYFDEHAHGLDTFGKVMPDQVKATLDPDA